MLSQFTTPTPEVDEGFAVEGPTPPAELGPFDGVPTATTAGDSSGGGGIGAPEGTFTPEMASAPTATPGSGSGFGGQGLGGVTGGGGDGQAIETDAPSATAGSAGVAFPGSGEGVSAGATEAPSATTDGSGFGGVGTTTGATGTSAPGVVGGDAEATAAAGVDDGVSGITGDGTESDGPEASGEAEASAEVEDGLVDSLDASPTSESDEDVCFPGSATVELEGGVIKTMRQVQIGDRVRVGKNEYSPVFMFTHRQSSTVHAFVAIETESGASLRATKSHYIPVADGHLVAAGALQTGDIITLADGSQSAIASLKSVRDTGLYNPQTIHGNIVVNGVVASTFTRSVQPQLASALLAPFRAAFKHIGFSTRFLEAGSSTLAGMVPSGDKRVRWIT